jgi:hypothetical protein
MKNGVALIVAGFVLGLLALAGRKSLAPSAPLTYQKPLGWACAVLSLAFIVAGIIRVATS